MGYPLKVDHIDVLQLPQECDLPVEKKVYNYLCCWFIHLQADMESPVPSICLRAYSLVSLEETNINSTCPTS